VCVRHRPQAPMRAQAAARTMDRSGIVRSHSSASGSKKPETPVPPVGSRLSDVPCSSRLPVRQSRGPAEQVGSLVPGSGTWTPVCTTEPRVHHPCLRHGGSCNGAGHPCERSERMVVKPAYARHVVLRCDQSPGAKCRLSLHYPGGADVRRRKTPAATGPCTGSAIRGGTRSLLDRPPPGHVSLWTPRWHG